MSGVALKWPTWAAILDGYIYYHHINKKLFTLIQQYFLRYSENEKILFNLRTANLIEMLLNVSLIDICIMQERHRFID